MRRWVWLAVLAALVLGVGLGQDRLMRMDDEGLYVRIALEMFQRGDWTVPTWFGGPGWFKPPGLYWSMFPWFALLGPTLLAGRVAALLWGAGTLAVTVAFGCRARGPQAGLLSGLVLLTCCSFVKYSRVGMMEAPLLFFYVAVLYSFYRARLGDGPIWDFLWPALTGVSTLVKGPVTALVLGLTLLFHRGVPW
ncbi:MAG TPA: glycosyltransferase family 39 protein, partial [Candidatus Xenobia bacterium]